MDELLELRKEIDKINHELLTLLSERAKIAIKIGEEKQKSGQAIFDPIREQQILEDLIKKNDGPFSDETIISLFKQIFKASINLQEENCVKKALVSRKMKQTDTIITIKNMNIGETNNTLIFGPCSIESHEQLETVAKMLKQNGLKYLRGGAFKPRTSPYDFQGLGLEGLKMIKAISEKYDLISVVEIMDKDQLSLAEEYVDIIQVGTRNMQNYNLLKALGSVSKPIILKRGYAATIEEFKLAAEYIISSGNENVILCERGIRTFEKSTRNTLDISAVPVLKNETHLPVIVDVSHAAGRKDILSSLALASLAAGADGIMAEIHPNPKVALSDAEQQMDMVEFSEFYQKIKQLVKIS